MAIDTTIQFNDHNSYKITTPLFCYPFGVDGMSYITHSFQAYATSSLSSANRAKTKFFDADGSTLSEVNHAFAVTTVFGKIEITVAVPATAKQAQLVLLQGGTDWWIAEPKSEQGEVATPYNVNYQGQLTYITPNGIYTGMMTTGQIVVTGSVGQPSETLDTRLVTINNGVINLSSTLSAKTTKITNEGVYTGEVRADQITVGQIQGPQLADGSVSDVKITSGLSATKITAGKLQSVDGKTYFDLTNAEIKQTATISGHNIVVTLSPTKGIELTSDSIKVFGINSNGAAFISSLSNVSNPAYYMTYGYQGSPGIECFYPLGGTGAVTKFLGISPLTEGGFAFFDMNINQRINVTAAGSYHVRDQNNTLRLALTSAGNAELRDQNGSLRLGLVSDGSMQMRNGDSGLVMVSSPDYTAIYRSASLNNSLGVDSTGPYYVKAGTKHYF